MTKQKIAALAAALLSAAFVSSGSAWAGERLFHFDRASLDYSQGVLETLERVEGFARRSCVESGRRGLWAARLQKECIALTAAEMVEKIDDGRLAAAAQSTAYLADRR